MVVFLFRRVYIYIYILSVYSPFSDRVALFSDRDVLCVLSCLNPVTFINSFFCVI